jgi:hypothetical protein
MALIAPVGLACELDRELPAPLQASLPRPCRSAAACARRRPRLQVADATTSSSASPASRPVRLARAVVSLRARRQPRL